MKTSVLVVNSLDRLAPYHEDLMKLATRAAEPNVFYEPWMLIPGLRHLAPTQGVQIILVLEATSERLVGLFPLILERRYRNLPIRCYTSWKHKYSASATPLIEKGTEKDCLAAFLQWLDESHPCSTWIRFRLFAGNGGLYEELKAIVREQGRQSDEIEVHERALLETGLSSQDYFKRHLSRKYLKEHRRLWNRLSELGELSYKHYNPGQHDIEVWLADFLALEHIGWKGRAGTAIDMHPSDKAFFTEMVLEAVRHNRLAMSRLELDGVMLACECTFLSGASGFMLKIVYDERYAKYSPGVLLVMRKTEAALDHATLNWLDSCAVPDHPMINTLWKQRLRVFDFSVSSSHSLSKVALSGVKVMVAVKHWLHRIRSK